MWGQRPSTSVQSRKCSKAPASSRPASRFPRRSRAGASPERSPALHCARPRRPRPPCLRPLRPLPCRRWAPLRRRWCALLARDEEKGKAAHPAAASRPAGCARSRATRHRARSGLQGRRAKRKGMEQQQGEGGEGRGAHSASRSPAPQRVRAAWRARSKGKRIVALIRRARSPAAETRLREAGRRKEKEKEKGEERSLKLFLPAFSFFFFRATHPARRRLARQPACAPCRFPRSGTAQGRRWTARAPPAARPWCCRTQRLGSTALTLASERDGT